MKDKNKKIVSKIRNMDEDFAEWYTDIVKQAGLASYSSVKGCMIIEPYGYSIWESMISELDKKFKETGHQNLYMPMFIPEDLLQKEKNHVEGFAPEVAWVTEGGEEKLATRLCIRPTSETLFCEYYSSIIKSYRDLPKLYNQWCSVVRWEKSTRPFLRSREFLWQEGHTVHAIAQEAIEETLKMFKVYIDFFENFLAIPIICGKKTENEKFAGAIDTYAVEAMMQDGQGLQSATSHYFGDKFARAFDIKYLNSENNLEFVHQTSWGSTTRMIGAVIMVHGDNNGLVLPPKLAPTQIVIVPIASNKPGVLESSRKVYEKLKSKFRIKLDDSDRTPGWKFSQYEMLGIPLRIEIGPKDLENDSITVVRRFDGQKISILLDTPSLETKIFEILDDIQILMFEKAKKRLEEKTKTVKNHDEFIKLTKNHKGFIVGNWCGNSDCEMSIKEETGFTSRCIVSEDEIGNCIYCGKTAKKSVYWGRAY